MLNDVNRVNGSDYEIIIKNKIEKNWGWKKLITQF